MLSSSALGLLYIFTTIGGLPLRLKALVLACAVKIRLCPKCRMLCLNLTAALGEQRALALGVPRGDMHQKLKRADLFRTALMQLDIL
jgi:hypothetical protein